MKNTFVKKKNHYLLTGLLFCAAALVTASAQNSFVTFSVDLSTNVANGTFNPATESVSVRGTFNNWSGSGGTFGDGSVQLTEQGLSAPYIYTNTVQDTFDANGTPVEYKFIIETNTGSGYSATYETLSSGYNRNAFLPTVSGATVVLPTPYFSDSGGVTSNLVTFSVDMHEQSYLGNFNPGSGDEITVEGNFQGWGTAHGALVLVNNGGTVYTNTFGITNSPYAVEEYKFVIYNPGTLAAGYESVAITNQDRDSNNRFFAGPQPAPLTLPLVDYSDTAYSPIIVSNITFSVDMSIVAATDTNFDRNTVTVDGSMNSWAMVLVPIIQRPPTPTSIPAPRLIPWVWVPPSSTNSGTRRKTLAVLFTTMLLAAATACSRPSTPTPMAPIMPRSGTMPLRMITFSRPRR